MSDTNDNDYAFHPPTQPTSEPSAAAPTPARKAAFHIVHRESGRVVGKASTQQGARRARDRHDNNYGSYAHKVVEVGGDRERL